MMESDYKFLGFKRSYKTGGYFMYPTELEGAWTYLSGAEQKVLDFILRQTYGYQNLEDSISLSQFTDGYGKRNKGCGVSRAQVQRVLASLERKNFITTEANGYRTRHIRLVLRDEEAQEQPKNVGAASGQVAYLISLFREINPHMIDGFLTNKTQVEAMERLLAHYNPEKIEQFVQAAQHANGKMYAPSIVSPKELEQKLSSLINFLQKERNKSRPREILL